MWACFCWLQKCWVCSLILKTMPSCPGLTPMLHSTIGLTAGSAECFPFHRRASLWWASPLQGKDFLQVCEYLRQQQSYVMPLLNLMTSMICYTKSLQLCPTLCDPIDGSPPGSPIPGILQARTLEWQHWVAISFSSAWKWKVKVKSLSPVQL